MSRVVISSHSDAFFLRCLLASRMDHCEEAAARAFYLQRCESIAHIMPPALCVQALSDNLSEMKRCHALQIRLEKVRP